MFWQWVFCSQFTSMSLPSGPRIALLLLQDWRMSDGKMRAVNIADISSLLPSSKILLPQTPLILSVLMCWCMRAIFRRRSHWGKLNKGSRPAAEGWHSCAQHRKRSQSRYLGWQEIKYTLTCRIHYHGNKNAIYNNKCTTFSAVATWSMTYNKLYMTNIFWKTDQHDNAY